MVVFENLEQTMFEVDTHLVVNEVSYVAFSALESLHWSSLNVQYHVPLRPPFFQKTGQSLYQDRSPHYWRLRSSVCFLNWQAVESKSQPKKLEALLIVWAFSVSST